MSARADLCRGARCYVRANVELSESRPGGRRGRAVDASLAVTRIAFSIVIAPSTRPNAAEIGKRQFNSSILVALEDKTACLFVAVVGGGEESGVDLSVAVIDHRDFGTARNQSSGAETIRTEGNVR